MSGRTSTMTVLTVAGLTVVGGFIAYAAYFDYKRRSDPSFRKKIRSQKKKVQQHVAKAKEERAAEETGSLDQIPKELIQALHEKSQEEILPDDADERHQYFVSLVGQAEMIAAQGPEVYLEAAIYFYRALRAYPSKEDLLNIYSKSIPPPVFMIVLQLHNLDVSERPNVTEKDEVASLDGSETNQESGGPPSETSSQEWDQVIKRITGYYEHFPPKSMNVTVKRNDPDAGKGGQTRVYSLLAAKDFKAGEEIYTESPIVAVLDSDLQGRGSHCSHCLRHIVKGMAIIPDSDRLNSVYCSKKCQMQSKAQSHNLLFGSEDIFPAEIGIQIPDEIKQARPKTQEAFVEYLRSSSSSGLLLTARVVAMQIISQFAKAMPEVAGMKADLPELSLSPEYSIYDHMERLRYLEMQIPDDEYGSLSELLKTALPFVENGHPDERHTIFRGKMAYNAIGVVYGGGRDDKPALNEKSERTRTPYGTAKQVGSGMYLVSAYLNHSCSPSVRPSFSNGTSELHLIAARDIKEGEELTMSYVDVSQHEGETVSETRKRRRKELSLGWEFTCACERCIEEGEKIAAEGEVSAGEAELLPTRDGAKLEATVERYT